MADGETERHSEAQSTRSEQECSLEDAVFSDVFRDPASAGSVTDDHSLLSETGTYDGAVIPPTSRHLVQVHHGFLNLQQPGFETHFKALPTQRFQQTGQRDIFQVFDMRNDHDYGEGFGLPLSLDRVQAAQVLQVQPDQIYECPNRLQNMRTLIVGAKHNEKYIFVKNEVGFRCLRIKKNLNADKLTEQLRRMGDDNAQKIGLLFHGAFDSHSEVLAEEKSVCLLFKKKPVDVADVLNLPSMSVVEFMYIIPLMWRIYHRYKLFCDKRYLIQLKSNDTLESIKHAFLALYEEVDGKRVPAESMWLTQHNNMITDTLLEQTFNTITMHAAYNTREIVMLTERDPSSLRLCTDMGNGKLCIDNVYVHFQPQNAVSVEVAFKPHTRQETGITTLTVVSPQISASDLREEVSKVVGKEPNSIKISVGGVRLDSKVDLSKIFRSPDVKIFVTPKTKITLYVHVAWIPSGGDEESAEFHLSVYSYDLVKTLKKEVSRLTGASQYNVDLHFQGRSLSEDLTLSENRIRDKDTVEAQIFPNRLKLLIRMPDRRWYDCFVDDHFDFTVGQVKTSAQTLETFESVHDCDLTAIFNNRVVADGEVLGHFTAGLRHTPKLCLVRTRSICFTAASAYKGTFAAFASTGESWFQQYLLMTNGEDVFQGPAVSAEDGKVRDLLKKRGCAVQPPPKMTGIKIIPHHQQVNLDDSPGRKLAPAVHDRSSSASSSDTSASSTPRLALCQENKVARNVATTENRQTVGNQNQTHGKVRRSSSVRFHTGNSIPDFGTLGDEQTTSEAPEVELQTEDSEDSDGNDTPTEQGNEKREQRSRQRSRSSPPSSGSLSESASSPDRERSKSCPPLPVATRPQQLTSFSSAAQRSDSESAVGKKEINCTMIVNEQYIENPDGTWTVNQTKRSQACLTPELMQKRLMASPCVAPDLQVVPAGAFGGQVTQYTDQQSQTLALPDPAYRYMKEDVIRQIARHLGHNGLMIIRQLGVTQDIIDQANAAHPKELTEMFFYCLRAWCMKTGCKANKTTLKKALDSWHRKDLMEMVDEIDPDPETDLNAETDPESAE